MIVEIVRTYSNKKKPYHFKLSPKEIAETNKKNSTKESFRLPSLYYPCNTILGITNAGKLKLLFSYGLPCMYSGIEMIDPKKVQKLLKNKAFEGTIIEVLEKIQPFEKSLQEVEIYAYQILKQKALTSPQKTVSEIFKEITPYYQLSLRKEQAPIFQKLIILAKNLPSEARYEFIQLMTETRDKLADRPILVPFNTDEFKYKLHKIKEDIKKYKNLKANKVMYKLQMESEKLPVKNTKESIPQEQKIINFLKIILRTSVLKDNEQLLNLLSNASERLEGQKVLIPFNRKSFIYDLGRLVENINDTNLKEEILKTAEKLPTSRDCISAYIMKYSTEPSEKIIYRMLWPSLASVEHIFPKSCGGIDDLSNFGGACTRENSDRKSIDFCSQINRKPETKENCQKYIDKLIELAINGVFEENNIDTKYIEEFKNTIFEESNGEIILDISRFYEKMHF